MRTRIKSLNSSLLSLIFFLAFCGNAMSNPQISAAKGTRSRAASNSKVGVSDARFVRLRRGINTSRWFAQVYDSQGYTHAHFTTHTTERDIRLIKSLGFDHIRFSLNPAPMMNDAAGSTLPVAYLRDVDAALDMILRHNLAVIVDIHPEDDFKRRIATDENYFLLFTRFWGILAHHLARRDAERVFLEVLNEPIVEDAEQWASMQARLVAEIRRHALRHTIIATGHKWSSLYELQTLKPLPDPNIIYNFHFYEPHAFTHQGATWGLDVWRYFKGVPYPSTPAAVAKMLPLIENRAAHAPLIAYGVEAWNRTRIEAEIAKVAAWARQHNVRLTCNEFGVYRQFAAPLDRAAYLHDVRASLERYGIGWAMWDYQGGFSVVNRACNRITPDAMTIAALGLPSPPDV